MSGYTPSPNEVEIDEVILDKADWDMVLDKIQEQATTIKRLQSALEASEKEQKNPPTPALQPKDPSP